MPSPLEGLVVRLPRVTGTTDVSRTGFTFRVLNKDFAGVTDVFSTKKAFTALNKNDGTAQRVFRIGFAFRALNKDDGTAHRWGVADRGGAALLAAARIPLA